jgi:hypothetical protein
VLALTQQRGHLVRTDRRAEQESLHHVAAVVAQERELLRRLDASAITLRSRLWPSAMIARDRRVIRVERQIAYETTVDLETVERECLR